MHEALDCATCEGPLPGIEASYKVPAEPEPRAGQKGIARLGFAEDLQRKEA
jgi:hypothetical protein